jgi:hypothetical protein
LEIFSHISLELAIRTPHLLFCIYSSEPENKATPHFREAVLETNSSYIDAATVFKGAVSVSLNKWREMISEGDEWADKLACLQVGLVL